MKRSIKKFSNTFRLTVAALFCLVVGLHLMLNSDYMSKKIATTASNLLSEKLDSKVYIDNVHVGLLNKFDLHDISILDKKNDTIFKARQLSVRVSVLDILKKQINIKHIGLYSASCNLYKETPQSPLNCQHIIEKLSSDDTKSSDLKFSANSIVCHDVDLHYNVLSQPTATLFTPSHLNITNLSGSFSIKKDKTNATMLRVRNLQFTESSGLKVNRLAFLAQQTDDSIKIKKLLLELPHSTVKIPQFLCDTKPNKFIDGFDLTASVTPSDFKCFYAPLKDFGQKYNMQVNAKSFKSSLMTKLHISDQSKSVANIALQGIMSQNVLNGGTFHMQGDIQQCRFSSDIIAEVLQIIQQESIKPYLLALGDIEQSGTFEINGKKITFDGITKTDIGSLNEDINYTGNDIDCRIAYNNLDIEKIITDRSSNLNNCTGEISAKGTISPLHLNINSKIDHFSINNYAYHDINISGVIQNDNITGQIDIRDENLTATVKPDISLGEGRYSADINADIEKIALKKINVSDVLHDDIASAKIHLKAHDNTNGKTINLALSGLNLKNEQSSYRCDTLNLTYTSNNTADNLKITSEFLNAHISSGAKLDNIPNSLFTFVASSVPAIKRYVDFKPNNRNIDFNISLNNTSLIERLLNIPVELDGTANIRGYIDHRKNSINITSWLPKFKLNGEPYSEGTVFLRGDTDSLNLLAQVSKYFKETKVKLVMNTSMSQNTITPSFEWKTLNSNGTSGNINLKCLLYGPENKDHIADLHVYPSNFTILDTLWSVSSSDIRLKQDGIHISPLELRQGEQFISIHNQDSYNSPFLVTINGMEISHLQNLLNFHPVEFSGNIYGTMSIPSRLSEQPMIPLGITVRNFHFQDGDMGTLHVTGSWDNTEKRINLDAMTRQSQHDSLKINGFVDIADNSIELNFSPRYTSTEFLNSWLKGVLGEIKGTVSGQLQLKGPLDSLDLYGRVVLDTLRFTPPVTNALYTMASDSIFFEEGKIIFEDFLVHDTQHGSCVVIGAITHNKLEDFGYDLSFDANNLLAYNHSGIDNNDFWGTVYADGNGRLHGNTSTVRADLNLSPKYGSNFYYNSSETENASGSEYIYFHNGETQDKSLGITENKQIENFKDNSSDVYLNLTANINPNAQIVIYTDRKTGDGLYLRGNGPIDISWHNKGKFRINGLYTTTGGEYHLTIQDLMKRNFQIQPEGYLRFSGNAKDGDLNLKSIYTVHSVSLSDLNIGQNISNATTNVNCILNFGGKANNPQVTFDLDFPTAGDDMRQTLQSAISSQEDLNMQMLYLLTVGRFYTYDYETSSSASAQNQSVLAMQSLFANTLGNSLGSIIGQALHLNNWTFGPNISTGRLGFDDMEVGGQFQGSLLQNRLQLSGNFGYREQNTYANNFVGDFNLRWLLNPKGTISLNAYSETNDRYFSKSSLSTQGGGIMFQHNFNKLSSLFRKKKTKK